MYSLTRLNNGSQVLFAPIKETETVTVLVLVKVGSRYESKSLNGASHFIEHLLFKGTKKRPTSLDLTKELDGVGADFNAFTAKDHTGYYIKVNKEKLELAMDIVSDMLLNSVFKSEEINKERGVIIEEINMYDDNPLLTIDNIFEEAIFKGNSLARDISGPKKNIKNISRAEIVKYFKEHYFAANVIIGVCGSFNNKKAEKLVEKYFNQPSVKSGKSSFKNFNSKQLNPQINLKTKETEQVQIALGYPAYKLTDPKLYPLNLLSVILGGNMSSRLFIEIREKLGLAYHIRSSLSVYQDTGALVVYAGLEKAKLELAIKTILKELNKLIVEKVSAEELKRSKDFIKGKLTLSFEDSAQRIQWLATQQLLKDNIVSFEEKIKKINQVTAVQIQEVAKEIIKKTKINLGIIGPDHEKNKFLNILN